MEPVLTTILPIVAIYLGNKLLDGSLEAIGSELSKGAIGWVKSLFFKEDDTPKQVLEDLKSNPDDVDNRAAVRLLIRDAVKNDTSAEQWLQEIHALLQKQAKAGDTTAVNVINSKNVVTAPINAGGNVIIGDRT